MVQHVTVAQIIDSAPARVVVTRDGAGSVTDASFDLSGLPRVDAMLTGRPVIEVPGLVERLCGICPAAHHLAGIRALEALSGITQIPPTAMAVRRLLHYASVIAIHIVGVIVTDQVEALTLRRFAKAGMTAAGSPGHFPATAVPGGVVAPSDPELCQVCVDLVPEAMAAAIRLVERSLGTSIPADHFDGADIALVDDSGNLDLFGMALRAVAADGTTVIEAALPAQWDQIIAEANPGSSTPKPYILALGSRTGAYRVGPVAQLRVAPLPTPQAGYYQQQWRQSGGGAASARTIIILHAVETIAELITNPNLVNVEVAVPWTPDIPAGTGVGWVDGARGLLVHRYVSTMDGRMESSTILTPTAQNEIWLSELLREAAHGDMATAGLEDAIREADPCLPCSSAPAGTMDLVIDTIESEGQ